LGWLSINSFVFGSAILLTYYLLQINKSTTMFCQSTFLVFWTFLYFKVLWMFLILF
jgi:hypothetical protein